ncbi:MAG TPA: hypothetical protein VKB88_00640 [Bryobacteraceae bacterium]|nr:hypothetical protein [Bryobacteraceae bacterium]
MSFCLWLRSWNFKRILAAGLGAALAGGAFAASVSSSLLSGLHWRHIGPAMFSSRVDDVAGIPGNRDILYSANSTGGLWKSSNGGITFESVFNDGGTLSVGAMAISPENPNIVYIGTGEGFPRNSISYGDGLYKTTDGGKTWKNTGLRDSQRFSRIVVDPKTPSIVYAAAMGHAFATNPERGIYRSNDAGATWRRVLFVDDRTGASDVAVDPQNPRIVYAGMYEYIRKPWTYSSGGPGSGLYRSEDGGETWTKLTDPKLHNGLPGAKLLGRIGISICYSKPNVVYALMEAQEPGVLWRSSDRGLHWTLVNSSRNINNRPFYYTQVHVDPNDENRVFTLSGSFNLSNDGGRTFSSIPGASMFGDHHALWIDPTNSKRMLSGTDGGFFITNDGGEHWDFKNKMPVAQPYHVGVDMAEPYNVMGGFQDHEIWVGPSEKWNQAGVREGDWHRLRNMADGMYALADPRDPNIIYYNGHFGDITRLDRRNDEEHFIQPYPPGPAGGGADLEKYRFNWNSPIHMSATNPDVVYYGGNVLFKTTDGGMNWTVISPDLTTNDKEKQRSSGGPITPDNTRAEFHCTIVTIAESPRDPQVIWAGTDDGNVQVTRDGGGHWTNVVKNIPGHLPAPWVKSIQASWKDAGTAYVAIDQHWQDDFRPHAFMTTDYGQTWKEISAGLNSYTHIVMEDPKQPNLLYAGTELGIFASFDRGDNWTDIRLGEPHISVVDMKVHPRDNDLIIASHSGGFYILDDVSALQGLARSLDKNATLFKPMRATRYVEASDTSVLGNGVWVARNKPYGAIISYYLSSALPRVELTILDSTGKALQTLQGSGNPGVNRVVWGLQGPGCPAPPASMAAMSGGRGGRGGGGRGGRRAGAGPRVMPGDYRVRLTALGETEEQEFTVRLDPRVKSGPEDLAIFEREVSRLHGTECAISSVSMRVGLLESQLSALNGKLPNAELTDQSNKLRSALEAITQDTGELSARLRWLVEQVNGNLGRPTTAQIEYIGIYNQRARDAQAKLDALWTGDAARLSAALQAVGLAALQLN